MEQESEARQIARGLRRRDVAVIQELVQRYQYRLMRYLLYLTGQRSLAEDLFQETWLRVLERGSQFDGRARFEPWLFSIGRNLAMDHFRRKTMTSLDTPAEDALSPLDIPDSAAPSPFELAARNEDASRLAQALFQLAPIYREALVLRFQDQLSLHEIADVVDAPVPTVSSRIQRALAALRSQLAPAELAPRIGGPDVR